VCGYCLPGLCSEQMASNNAIHTVAAASPQQLKLTIYASMPKTAISRKATGMISYIVH